MIIKTVQVRNFRSLLNAEIHCDGLTALVGRNGAGKSSFLKAIDLFYQLNPRLSPEDFYNRNVTSPIEITVTFTALDAEELERFKSYIQNDELSVARVLTLTDNKYHGSALQNPDFKSVRNAESAGDLKDAYKQLREGKYQELPAYTNKDAVKNVIKEWESKHTDACIRERDDGQFFGFKQVGQGFLGKDTRFIFIPAVRDASDDAEEGRGSAITELMDLVVRKALFEKKEIKQFKADIEKKYSELLDPTQIGELSALSQTLTNTLKTYVFNASVNVSWENVGEITIPQPKADIQLVEDGFPSEVGRTGHGLQRAFILTILQHLAAPQLSQPNPESEVDKNIKQPDFIFGIEEPELYQHPSRQRHFANVLLKLAANQIPGVARRVQIIYATHSPLMVGLDRFDQIRLIRKTEGEPEKPKVTEVIHRSLDDVASVITSAIDEGAAFTGMTLKPRLVTLMSPWMSEGFFADVVVLVEGEGDRAAVLGMAQAMESDFDGSGIAVIPCIGKPNVFNAASIFSAFTLPTYAIWDGDSHLGQTAGKCGLCGHNLDTKADPKENHRLLRLENLPVVDWPKHVGKTSACFEQKLETTMKDEIGEELFFTLVDDCKQQFGMNKRKDAVKNPALLAHVLEEARKQQKTSATLEAIVNAIIDLKNSTQ
jgi:putative ATP-dependent endonuclease of the OLD family